MTKEEIAQIEKLHGELVDAEIVGELIAHVRKQDKALAAAQKLCRGIAVGWHRSTLKQMLDKSTKGARDWLERYGDTK